MLGLGFQQGVENLVARLDGPLHVRFLLQPAVAGFLAIRAGLRDARTGRSPFLWKLATKPEARRALLRDAWKDVGTVFIVAVIADVIYQIIVHSHIYPIELLLTATLLALVPYVVLRGLVTRAARSWGAGSTRTGKEG